MAATWQPFELYFVEIDGVGHPPARTDPAHVRTVRDWLLGYRLTRRRT